MRNDRNALQEFQHSLESLKGNFRVLETTVSVDTQMEFFRFSEAIRNDPFDEQAVENQINVLTSAEPTPAEKKYALSVLAVSGNVKAYRAIESYHERYPDDWSNMALMQAKMTLESEFSDERPIFISTGLGGKGNRLRFYAFFKSKGRKKFSEYQRNLITKEIPYYIQNYQGISEEIQIRDNYFTLLFLIHIQVDIKTMLAAFVEECNQYGNFIDTRFVITNVKMFTEEEIQNELMRKE